MEDEKMDQIKGVLEDIKTILLLVNQDKIDDIKKELLKQGSIEEKIYEMCDGKNTTADIVKAIQKDNHYVNTVIGILRHKGLIKTIEKNGDRIHRQVL